jgi:phage FluMu protein Com
VNSLKEKVAYIRGMAEGMDLDRTDARTKLMLQILDLLNEMVVEVDDLTERIEDNEDLIEALDSDLADVEEYVFEDDAEGCDHLHEDDDDPTEFEVQCPHCDEIVFVNEDDLEEVADEEVEILCPNCNQVIFSDEEDDDEGLTEAGRAVPID